VDLDAAADLKFLASEEYLTAMKQWETIAKSMGPGRGMIYNQTAKVNADIAWESYKRALDEKYPSRRLDLELGEKNVAERTAALRN